MPDKLLQPSGPGRPKDPAKRRAILDAAKNLFLRNGYDGSSMDTIAAEAGVSKLTVYSHFTDKETLFSAAIKAKCEEQLPELLFELPDDVPLESQLLGIARGFLALINSSESVEMHRMMVSLASQGSKLSRMFYEAGPQRVQEEMELLLRKASERGLLQLDDPHRAADHFFSLLKGGAHFRLLIGCGDPLQGAAAEHHVQDSVQLFLRAYRADR
ncbi:Biofilm operon icaADBC HTH-type negative transcriptional regulator IcaR [Pseudomonas sp. THAF187a]|uniref:TetR/AcrR family transcriptional regulator n=1 Tax=Ectopseudomonas khazarica TaxID=2502979 RepID=A0ABW7MI88_9GAMM|nr:MULTISPECIES: TetR/AcrR family transcriptional regulator [unclassified Pseudomonas]QFT23426.1 Biofilm operon icaADBC HTH-type negative transcriptional regulator IcaR [Pseudomonas sp. THAF187a]QFT43614.1 Biofilm operon icaADBC HTH-type negative transcriptional regulator IcaR [Pseudomonas sp. THAF42]TNF10833.1 MAG: TetR/AcrR family transcriptional regulator [Pseudomonadales bacterium]WFC63527.1 TetR/AcrR family transcriptional regulator [Pseudomonas sp. REST10]